MQGKPRMADAYEVPGWHRDLGKNCIQHDFERTDPVGHKRALADALQGDMDAPRS